MNDSERQQGVSQGIEGVRPATGDDVYGSIVGSVYLPTLSAKEAARFRSMGAAEQRRAVVNFLKTDAGAEKYMESTGHRPARIIAKATEDIRRLEGDKYEDAVQKLKDAAGASELSDADFLNYMENGGTSLYTNRSKQRGDDETPSDSPGQMAAMDVGNFFDTSKSKEQGVDFLKKEMEKPFSSGFGDTSLGNRLRNKRDYAAKGVGMPYLRAGAFLQLPVVHEISKAYDEGVPLRDLSLRGTAKLAGGALLDAGGWLFPASKVVDSPLAKAAIAGGLSGLSEFANAPQSSGARSAGEDAYSAAKSAGAGAVMGGGSQKALGAAYRAMGGEGAAAYRKFAQGVADEREKADAVLATASDPALRAQWMDSPYFQERARKVREAVPMEYENSNFYQLVKAGQDPAKANTASPREYLNQSVADPDSWRLSPFIAEKNLPEDIMASTGMGSQGIQPDLAGVNGGFGYDPVKALDKWGRMTEGNPVLSQFATPREYAEKTQALIDARKMQLSTEARDPSVSDDVFNAHLKELTALEGLDYSSPEHVQTVINDARAFGNTALKPAKDRAQAFAFLNDSPEARALYNQVRPEAKAHYTTSQGNRRETDNSGVATQIRDEWNSNTPQEKTSAIMEGAEFLNGPSPNAYDEANDALIARFAPRANEPAVKEFAKQNAPNPFSKPSKIARLTDDLAESSVGKAMSYFLGPHAIGTEAARKTQTDPMRERHAADYSAAGFGVDTQGPVARTAARIADSAAGRFLGIGYNPEKERSYIYNGSYTDPWYFGD